MTRPEMKLEVLAQGEGYTVASLAGTKMPLVVFHPGSIADLRRLFHAAALRLGDLPDRKSSDAVVEFVQRFESLLLLYDAESERYLEYLSERKDYDAAAREVEDESNALPRIGETRKDGDSN